MDNSHTLIAFFASLIGALIGGFPGAVLAFFIAVGLGSGEVVCCMANLALGVGGAYIGMLSARAIRGRAEIALVEVVLPALLGLSCGLIGYIWLYWEISHGEPPL